MLTAECRLRLTIECQATSCLRVNARKVAIMSSVLCTALQHSKPFCVTLLLVRPVVLLKLSQSARRP